MNKLKCCVLNSSLASDFGLQVIIFVMTEQSPKT